MLVLGFRAGIEVTRLVALLPAFWGSLITFWLTQALVPQMWKAVLNPLIKAHQAKALWHR